MAGTDFSGQEVGAAGPKAWIDLGSTLGWPEDFQTKPSASVAEKKAPGWPGGPLFCLSQAHRPLHAARGLCADFIVISDLSQLIAALC